jgi:hypothetical protein
VYISTKKNNPHFAQNQELKYLSSRGSDHTIVTNACLSSLNFRPIAPVVNCSPLDQNLPLFVPILFLKAFSFINKNSQEMRSNI